MGLSVCLNGWLSHGHADSTVLLNLRMEQPGTAHLLPQRLCTLLFFYTALWINRAGISGLLLSTQKSEASTRGNFSSYCSKVIIVLHLSCLLWFVLIIVGQWCFTRDMENTGSWGVWSHAWQVREHTLWTPFWTAIIFAPGKICAQTTHSGWRIIFCVHCFSHNLDDLFNMKCFAWNVPTLGSCGNSLCQLYTLVFLF